MLPILVLDLVVSVFHEILVVEGEYLRYVDSLGTRHTVSAVCAANESKFLVLPRIELLRKGVVEVRVIRLQELTDEAANQPYISPYSFGATYIEHRKALELSIAQHKELELYAHSKGLDFIETLCSPGCLELLKKVKVDAVKVASRDATNIPLLEKLGKLKKRIIISSGMCTLEELARAVKNPFEKNERYIFNLLLKL
jgi:hypothetical protein